MTNLPIKKLRSGSLDLAIWENKRKVRDGEEISFKTVSLRRSWKDKEQDIWRDEKLNLRRSDIPKAILLLQKAQEDLFLNEDNNNDGEED